MKGLSIIVFLFLVNLVSAQTLTITGKIVNAETLDPLPYANIQLEGTGIGTMSTLTGEFILKIPAQSADKVMSFSYMGFKTVLMPVTKLLKIHTVISLFKYDQLLDEVTIMPDSALLTLLEKAFKRIPDNYPMVPTRQNGFYRESAKYSENEYLYFSEAVMEMNKSSYKYSIDNGQVKILKSVTNEFPALKSFGYRISEGIFIANEGDFVKKKGDFINPRYFKNYDYSLSGTTNYQNYEVYVINFNTRDDSLKGETKGKIFIEKSTLAYVAFEVEATEKGLLNFNKSHIGTPDVKSDETLVEYVKFKDRWHVKHVVNKDVFDYQKRDLHIDGEFISTEIFTDLVKPITLTDRLNYNDIFSEKAKEYYSDDYWEEYNVLKKDSLLESRIRLLYDTVQSKKLLTTETKTFKKNNIYKTLSRFNNRFGLGILPVNGNQGLYSVGYNHSGNTISFTENLKPFDYALCLGAQLDYRLTNTWALNSSVSASLNKAITTKSHDVGASYKILLNRWTNPLIVELSLKYSFEKVSRNFSKNTNPTSFIMDNKKIDAHTLRYGIGYNTNGFLYQLGFNYQIKNNWWFYTSAGYFFPQYTSQKLYVSEKSGFPLFRKDSSIKLSNKALQVQYNGIPTTTSHVSYRDYNIIKAGFIIKF